MSADRAAVYPRRYAARMILRSIGLFLLSALTEIGGSWLVWQGVRDQRGLLWIGAGVASLSLYGFVATLQPDASFGRVLAAYGGVFIVGSMSWGVLFDGFRPDRWDITGALVCLIGAGIIVFAPGHLSSLPGSATAVGGEHAQQQGEGYRDDLASVPDPVVKDRK
jgi:small multidrug resistance family-3 protein